MEKLNQTRFLTFIGIEFLTFAAIDKILAKNLRPNTPGPQNIDSTLDL